MMRRIDNKSTWDFRPPVSNYSREKLWRDLRPSPAIGHRPDRPIEIQVNSIFMARHSAPSRPFWAPVGIEMAAVYERRGARRAKQKFDEPAA